jgi:hypothetical protein
MTGHARKAALGLARFGISIGLVALILWKVGVEDTIDRFALLDWRWALTATALVVVTGVLHAARWRLVLAARHHVIPFSSALREIWIGYFFNQLLPTSVGGDGVRAFRLHRAGAPLGTAFRGVLIERVFGLLACVALSVLAVPAMSWAAPEALATHAVAVIVVAGIVGTWVLLSAPRWALRLLPERIGREVRLLSEGISDPRYARHAMLVSVGMQLAVAASVACLSKGLGLSINPLFVAILFQPVTLLTLVPVSLAGWGLREGALVATLGAVGVSGAEALPLSLAFGAILLLISLPGGTFLTFGRIELSGGSPTSPIGSK